MTATISSTAPTNNGTSLLVPARIGGRRNRTRIALGLVVTVLCVLATATLFSSANHRTVVLTVRRTVPAGHAISSDDLATAGVSVGADVQTMGAATRDVVVGRVAAVTLVAGSLLVPADVSAAARVPVGMTIVGASLKPGQYPVSVAAGDDVELVETVSPATIESAPPTDRGAAHVLDVEPSSDGSGTLALSLLVPNGAAVNVAGDAAAGRLSVMVVG
jgi:SAF domain